MLPYNTSYNITASDLEELPTLAQGQDADLKIDTTFSGGKMRVWLSRCGVLDGETQPVQVERLVNGKWVNVTSNAAVHKLDGGFHIYYLVCSRRRLLPAKSS